MNLETFEQLLGPAWPAVNPRAHIREDFGDVLYLVEDHRRPHGVKKSLRVDAQPRHHVRVFQQEIVGTGKYVAQQPGFPGPSRARQYRGGKTPRRFADPAFKLARYVSHG